MLPEEHILIRYVTVGADKADAETQQLAYSFEKAGLASEAFRETMGRLSPRLGLTTTELIDLSNLMSGFPAKAEGAAVGVVELKAALANLGGATAAALKETLAEVEALDRLTKAYQKDLAAGGEDFGTLWKQQIREILREHEAMAAEVKRVQKETSQAFRDRASEQSRHLQEQQRAIRQVDSAYRQQASEVAAAQRAQVTKDKEINRVWEQRRAIAKTTNAEIERGYRDAAALGTYGNSGTRGLGGRGAFYGGGAGSVNPVSSSKVALTEQEKLGQAQVALDAQRDSLRRGRELQERIALRKKAQAEAIAKDRAHQKYLAQEQRKRIAAAKQDARAAATATARGGRGGPRFNVLGTAIGVAISAQVIKEVADLADQYVTLQNRIKLVTDTEAQRIVVTKQLFRISKDTRTSVDATAQIYQRLATSAGGLNISYRDLLGISESLNQAVVVGGSNFVEAEKGLLQFSQGMARGTLRGDELRSVMEQLPGVADVLANYFDVNRGYLAKMGEQGKITAAEIIKAFRAARAELAEKFAKTIPTISQGFGILRTEIIQFLGESSKVSAVSGAIGTALKKVGENLDTLAKLLVSGILYFGVTKFVSALGAIVTASSTVRGALSVLGRSVLLFGIVKAVENWDDLAAAIKETAFSVEDLTGALTGLQPVMEVTLVALGSGALVGGIRTLAGGTGLGLLVTVLGKLRTAMEAFLKLRFVALILSGGLPGVIAAAVAGTAYLAYNYGQPAARALGRRIGPIAGQKPLPRGGSDLRGSLAGLRQSQLLGELTEEAALDAKIKGGNSNLPDDANKRGRKTFKDYLEEARNAVEVLREEGQARTVLAGILRVENALRRELSATEKALLTKELETAQRLKQENELRNLAISTRRGLYSGTLRGDQRAVAEAQFAFADTTDSTDEELTAEQRNQIANLTILQRETERYNRILDEIKGTQVEYIEDLATLNRMYQEGVINLAQYTRKADELRLAQLSAATDLRSGIERGFLRLKQESTNLADIAENSITGAFQSAGDALADFVANGKFDIRSLVDTIISELARLAIQQAVIAPLSAAFSNVFSKTPITPTRTDPNAFGGPIDLSHLGGSGSGSGSGGGGGGGQSNVQINVTNQQGVTSDVKHSTGSNGEDIINILARQVTAKQLEDDAYGGGHAPAMRMYGLSKPGVHR